MERYVYIDETGDLGEKGSRYFIITAIWVNNPAVLDRVIKNARRNKFKKELKKAQEIKANKSSPQLIEDLLKKLEVIEEFHAQSIILKKEDLHSKFLLGDKHKLYNFVCGRLGTIATDSRSLIVRIDRSKGKQSLVDDFNHYMESTFREGNHAREVEIYHSWSQSWSGLQLADVVSWAVFCKFEHGNDHYFRLIEKKIDISHIWK